jgi:hypothetical protein
VDAAVFERGRREERVRRTTLRMRSALLVVWLAYSGGVKDRSGSGGFRLRRPVRVDHPFCVDRQLGLDRKIQIVESAQIQYNR